MSGDSDKCDNISALKKIEAAVALPDDLRIIHNVQQKLYRSLVIREEWDGGEKNSVFQAPLCGPVGGHYLRLEYAAIVQSEMFKSNLPEYTRLHNPQSSLEPSVLFANIVH